MIIVDYSGIAIASIIINKTNEEGLIRHMILNTLRMYRKKFKEDYGELVLAVDSPVNWRKDAFPQYKALRKKSRQKHDIDWEESFRILNLVREEIFENFPYKVIQIEGCEADDVIATLVEETQEFGKTEPVMIVSADHDFIQLQKYNNVQQYSPMTKKLVDNPNPRLYLLDHVLRGDTGDGVPNILSADNTFVDGLRQTPLTKKRKDELFKSLESLSTEEQRNYERNKMMIDLSETPSELKNKIIDTYDNQNQWENKGKVFPYLVDKKLKLIEDVLDFV